jgi:phosphoribosylamine--glycine ligase
VVEFNCRFGDPEAEAVLPLVGGDLGELLAGAARGALEPRRIERESGATVVVALTHEDYPGAARGEGVLEGLDALKADAEVTVFHAASRRDGGRWRLPAGRAAYVMARAGDHAAARTRVYRAIDRLGGSHWRCRRDIAAGVPGGREVAPAGSPARASED